MIRVSAVIVRDEAGRVLTVRKRGTTAFMLPGGKPEPGETPADTAARELREEILVDLRVDDLRPLGTFVAAAANEADTLVHADVFEAPPVEVTGPGAEIEELRWLSVDEQPTAGAALLLIDKVLPLLRRPTAE